MVSNRYTRAPGWWDDELSALSFARGSDDTALFARQKEMNCQLVASAPCNGSVRKKQMVTKWRATGFDVRSHWALICEQTLYRKHHGFINREKSNTATCVVARER